MISPRHCTRGFTLIEILISMAIGSAILGALTAFLFSTQNTVRNAQIEFDLYESANFALDRMVRAVERAQVGLVPLADNPGTAQNESVRSVLSVSMDPTLDRDMDGWSDANNDQDWLDYNNNGIRDPGEPEKIDEDPGHDQTYDFVAGVLGVDDDNDGQVDELMEYDDPLKSHEDDDEDGWKNDDNANGFDDDGDGSIDEDIKQEINDDEAPGQINLDDNFDGLVDDHPNYPNGGTSKEAKRDDDEDGVWNEDWIDAVVYYLGATEVYAAGGDAQPVGDAGTLYERLPDVAAADGTAFTSYVIATGIESFQVERLSVIAGDGAPLMRITLVAADALGHRVTVRRTVRLGAKIG